MANMKKLFLTLALLLPVTAMAQTSQTHWTAKTEQDLSGGATVIYATVNINGVAATPNDNVELAAFINNDCRADATAPDATHNLYTLRVVGTDGEVTSQPTITFQAYYGGVEYQFTTTSTYQGNYTPTVPSTSAITLNLDVVTGVQFTRAIDIEKRLSLNPLPWEEDLSDYIEFVYGNNGYTPSATPQSSIVGGATVSYSWAPNTEVTAAYTSDQIEFSGTTATIKELGNYFTILTVNYNGTRYQANGSIYAHAANVPVEAFSCNVTTAEVFTYTEFRASYFESNVTFSPEDATDKTYHMNVGGTGGFDTQDSVFTAGGVYDVSLIPNDQYYKGETPTVQVTVWERPAQIAAKNATITVDVNANVYDALVADTALTYLPNFNMSYMKQDVTITFGAEGFVDPQTHLALKSGQVTARVTLTNGLTPSAVAQFNPYIDVTVNIQSNLQITVSEGEKDFVKNGNPSTTYPAIVSVTNPNGEAFDASKLKITFSNRYVTDNASFPYAVQSSVSALEEGSYGFTILPLFTGTAIPFTVTYDGTELMDVQGNPLRGTITISKQEVFDAAGWYWMSVTNTTLEGGTTPLADAFRSNDIEEVRSQTALVYNDPNWGYFGDLTYISGADATYKVKTKQANATVSMGRWPVLSGASKTIKKGYNWMNNPYEFDIPVTEIDNFVSGGVGAAPFVPSDGDMIITQSGFITYDGTAWVGSITLKEGEGLVYYSTAEDPKTITYDESLEPAGEFAAPVKSRDARMSRDLGEEVFAYDPHAYADNMAMVAVVDGLENPEDFTIGVFVNDECRGRGHVAKDNVMFISAVGKVGEQMTFKLVNNATGEIINLDSTLKYTLRQGSLSAPVVLSGAEVTGIMETIADAQQSADENIYDLSGRRVDKMQKGIYIVNGKKVLVK